MPYHTVHEVELRCHPDTPAAARGVSARIGRDSSGMLAVSYVIEGDLARLRVPPELGPSARRPLRAARLWEHTCCEIFIACAGSPGYHELNFSPSGEWALEAFARYRETAPLAAEAHEPELDPGLTVRHAPAKLELDVRIRLARLTPAHAAAPLSVALATVLEADDGSLSYWALRHPPGRPDFHHGEGYALELAGTAAPPVRTHA